MSLPVTTSGYEAAANHDKLIAVNKVILTFIVIGLVAAGFCAGTLGHVATVTLWALACLAVGALVGLLFGIPRIRSVSPGGDNGQAADLERGYRSEINNNLMEISDWLTKIIVGVGLIELGSLPEKLKMIAGPLVQCLQTECGLAIAVALILYFTTTGFLAGYLNSRTFIALMLKESADQLFSKGQDNQASLLRWVGEREKPAGAETTDTGTRAPTPDPGKPDSHLLAMAADYESVRIADYGERVAAKDRIAAEMAIYLVRRGISKSTFFSWLGEQPSDGLIIAFASYVIAVPEKEDMRKLVSIGAKARLLHVKYRVCLALRELLRRSFGTTEELKQAVTLLESYREHARGRHDRSLQSIAQELLDMLQKRPE